MAINRANQNWSESEVQEIGEETMLKFYWNGIKSTDGKLQRAYISGSQLVNYPAGTITIYARDYHSFSAEVRAHFTVENNSDMMTDYFETDTIRVTSDHPLYAEARKALDARNLHYAKRAAKIAQG